RSQRAGRAPTPRVVRPVRLVASRPSPQATTRHREAPNPTRPRASPRGGEDELMNHEPYATLAATYAVGALDGQDRVEFERHLAGGCDICEATLRESAETLAVLARARPPMLPTPAVREELLRRIGPAPARRG